MSSPGPRPAELALWLYLTASAVAAATALSVGLKRASAGRNREPRPPAVALVTPPAEPIRGEAQVFRTTSGMVAIEPGTPRERSAHPRRLATVHFLRAFPGAPPRIPHNLGAGEFRTVACKTCH